MPAKRSPFGLKKRISPCHNSTEAAAASRIFVTTSLWSGLSLAA